MKELWGQKPKVKSTELRCLHCKQTKRRNRRVKGQKYCGDNACQQARKNAWERHKLQRDRDYKASRAASKRRWYETNRQGADYQSTYRKSHPDYIASNRLKQRNRAQNGKESAEASKIVKTDALSPQLVDKQGVVVILVSQKKDEKKIVKTDVLSSQVIDKELLMQIL